MASHRKSAPRDGEAPQEHISPALAWAIAALCLLVIVATIIFPGLITR